MVSTPSQLVSAQATSLKKAAASAKELKYLLEAAAWKEGQPDPEWVSRDNSGKFSSGGGGSTRSSSADGDSDAKEPAKTSKGSSGSVKERMRSAAEGGIAALKKLSKESREQVKTAVQRLGKDVSKTASSSLEEAHPALADSFATGINVATESDNAGEALDKAEVAVKEKHGNGDLAKKALMLAGAGILGVSAAMALVSGGQSAVGLVKLVANAKVLKQAAKQAEEVAVNNRKIVADNIAKIEEARKVDLDSIEKQVKERKRQGTYDSRTEQEAQKARKETNRKADDFIKEQKRALAESESDSSFDKKATVGLTAAVVGDAAISPVRALAEGAFAVGMVKSVFASKNQPGEDASVQAASGDGVNAEKAIMDAVQAVMDRLRSKKAALSNPSNEDLAALLGTEPRAIAQALSGDRKKEFERELNSFRTQVGSFMSGLLNIETTDPKQFLSKVQGLSSIADKVEQRCSAVKALMLSSTIAASAQTLDWVRASESAKQLKRLVQSAAWKEGQTDPEWVTRDKSGKFSSGGGGGSTTTTERTTSTTPDVENPQKNKFLKKVTDTTAKLKSAIGARIKEAQRQNELKAGTKNVDHGISQFGKIGQDAAIAAECEAGLNLMDEGILERNQALESAFKAQLKKSKAKIQERVEKLKSNTSLDDPNEEQLMSFLGVNPQNYQDAANSQNAKVVQQTMQLIKESVKDAKKAMVESDTNSPEAVLEAFEKSINHLAEADGSVRALMKTIGQIDAEGKPTSPENAKLLRSKGWPV